MTAKKGRWGSTGFGDRLKSLRENAGLSQQDLAVQAECSLFTVSKIERGMQEPAWPLVLSFARSLGVDVGAFIADPRKADPPGEGEAQAEPVPAEVSPARKPKKGK